MTRLDIFILLPWLLLAAVKGFEGQWSGTVGCVGVAVTAIGLRAYLGGNRDRMDRVEEKMRTLDNQQKALYGKAFGVSGDSGMPFR